MNIEWKVKQEVESVYGKSKKISCKLEWCCLIEMMGKRRRERGSKEEQVTFIHRALHCLTESSWSNKLPWALLKGLGSWGFIIECLYRLHVKDQKQMLPLANKGNNYSTPATN